MLPPVVGLLNRIAGCVAPLHTTCGATAFTVAVGLTVIAKVLGVPVQAGATAYWNKTLDIFVEDGSCQILCGTFVAKANCIPILTVLTGKPAIMIPGVPSPYELIPALLPSIPITSPELTGILTAIFPGVASFCVKNNVLNAFVVVANSGGGIFPVNRTTAML
jgi:hypothetical protein